MKKQLLAVLFGSALVLGACGGGGDEGADDATENGGEDQTEEQTGDDGDTGDDGGESAAVNADEAKEYFQQSCAGCHGGDLSGNNGPNLQTIGADYNKDEILDIIKNGKGSMPGDMASGDEAETIAAWLATKK